MTKSKASDLAAEYERRAPDYKKLVEEVQFGLATRLKDAAVTIAATEGRVKPLGSFLEKIERKAYKQAWDEIDDVAGIRLVCLFSTDLDVIEDAIRSLFDVISSENKTESLGVERMGYQGRHYVVTLARNHTGPRYDNLNNLRAEIQVRTTLQDAWARISHNLVYKSEASMPVQLRREIQNVSSLLEIAQNIFDRSESSRKQYITDVQKSASNVNQLLSQPIDRETLEAYTTRNYPRLPVDHRIQELLLRDLNQAKYTTLADIDDAVQAAESAVASYKVENPDWFKAGTDFITKSLGFFDPEFRRVHPFGKQTLDAFERHEKKVAKPKRAD